MMTHRCLPRAVSVVFITVATIVAGCTHPGQDRRAVQQPIAEVDSWEPDQRTLAIRHVLAAGVAKEKERPDWALEHYIDAMQLTEDLGVVERAVRLAVLLEDDKSIELAAKRLQDIAPDRAVAGQLLGMVALRRGDIDEAVAHFDRFIDGWQGAKGGAFALLESTLLHGVDDSDKALSTLKRLADKHAEVEQGHIVLAQTAERLGRTAIALQAAARAYQLALEQESDWLPRSAMDKARLLRKKGKEDAALAVYSEALEAVGTDVDLLYGRGVLRAMMGDDVSAEEDLRRVLELAPDDPHAMNALGYTLADNDRDLVEALELITKALEKRPNSAAILDSKGWVLYRLGRLEEALEYLERAWEQEKDAEIGAHLGELLWELDKPDKAQQVWRQAVEIDSSHSVLKETLERYEVDKEEL
ncbi:tetratricopeptide repeat protein [Halorhodospira halochloris]|uniref:tetratricopeptide repeat protein n=1 Tax=Halorhodospira halochloris TaxID=1052 RepID=UPI001EE95D0E|nr:tetratricopeptide repeat protein [Halorhodospira halochloris]MCG5529378.1 tetratricopeptide repeat protein [Halorhodospira halochloris]